LGKTTQKNEPLLPEVRKKIPVRSFIRIRTEWREGKEIANFKIKGRQAGFLATMRREKSQSSRMTEGK